MAETEKRPKQLSRSRKPELDFRLLSVGLVCVLAAIVAGGIEGLGITIPAINSLERQIILGAFGLLLIGLAFVVRTQDTPSRDELPVSNDRVPLPAATPRPRLSARFTGRDDVLDELRSRLVQSRRVALTGLGGVGKTQIALSYIERYRDHYEIVWWTRAEEPALLGEDLLGLATVYGVPVEDSSNHEQRIDAIRRWLSDRTSWLIILDNADSESAILPFIPDGDSGHILITSRDQHWHSLQTLTVGPWHRTESLAFLGPTDVDQRSADRLASYLGDLPLALDQATAYMRETSTNIEDYLELLQSRTSKILDLGGVPGYPKTVGRTWAAAFISIRSKMPVAQDLMFLCAFLSPEGIPHFLLRTPSSHAPKRAKILTEDRITYNRAIVILSKYSLIQVSLNEVTLHRLVQMVTRNVMATNEQKRWASVAIDITTKAMPEDIGVVSNWPRYAEVLPHALAAARHAAQYGVSLQAATIAFDRLGNYLRIQARFSEAVEILEEGAAIVRQPHDFLAPDLAGILSKMGMALRAQGELARARAVLFESVKIEEQQVGASHPKLAMSLNTLGTVLRGTGESAEAFSCHRRALRICEDTVSDDHPLLGLTLNNLGNDARGAGDAALAVRYHERALAVREAALDYGHPDIATSMNNLGNACADVGRLEVARTLLDKALLIDENSLGRNHAVMAAELMNLGAVCASQGELELAKTHLDRGIAIDEAGLGVDHPDVGIGLNNLGLVLALMSLNDEAADVLQHAMAVSERALGADHTDVGFELLNLSAVYAALGREREARDLAERAKSILSAALSQFAELGVDHRMPTASPAWLRIDKDAATAEIDVSDYIPRPGQ